MCNIQELKKLDSKKMNNPIKNGVQIETDLKRGNLNGCETLKEMFNILSHQGNANQNYFEISSHTY